MTSVHPYYLRKAHAFLTRAGAADDVDVEPLAAWAASDPWDDNRGAIVDAAGRVLAETKHLGSPVATHRVTTCAISPGRVGEQVAWAAPNLSRLVGMPVVHVRAWQVARGRATR